MTRNRLLIAVLGVLVVVLVAGAVYANIRVFELGSRLSNDEHQTCIIQARGLPAGHELAASMADIHALLTLPPTTSAQRRAARNTLPRVAQLVRELDAHLAAYSAAERQQPATRSCS